jgi:outer membrane protein
MNVRSRGILAALLVLAATPLSAQVRVGYVDSRKILQEMPARTAVETRLRVELEGLGVREKKMIDSLNVMVAAFEKDSSTLTAEERTKRFTALQQYDAQYRDTLQALQTEAQEKQATAMQPLFDQIKLALDEVRAADGLAFIFDIGAQGNAIVAMDKNLDVSDKVIARLRTQASAPPARPAAQPAPQRPAPAGPVAQPAGVRKP